MSTNQWVALGTMILLAFSYGILVCHPFMKMWERIGYALMFGLSMVYIALVSWG